VEQMMHYLPREPIAWLSLIQEGKTNGAMGRDEQPRPAAAAQRPHLPPRPPRKLLVTIDHELSIAGQGCRINRWQPSFALTKREHNHLPSGSLQLRQQGCEERRFPAAMRTDDLAMPAM